MATIMALTVAACAAPPPSSPITYRHNGVSYSTLDDYLAAVKREDDAIIAKMKPPGQKIGGTLLLVMPTLPAMLRARDGNPQIPPPRADLVSRTDDVQFTGLKNTLERSELFDTVIARRVDTPTTGVEEGASYKLSIDRYGTPASRWVLTARDGRSQALAFPPGNLNHQDWLNSVAIAVVNAAADLGAPVRHQPLPVPISSGPISGSAFFVDGLGHAVTAAHVLAACKSIELALGDGKVAEARIAASDRANDLALLSVAPANANYARFTAAAPRQGDTVVLYGFPLAGALSTQGNLSTGIINAMVGLRDDSREYQISAPVQQGDSGGPVFDRYGALIGMVIGKINTLQIAAATGDVPQNVNFALKANILTSFLETSGIRYELGAATRPLETADIGDRAKSFTYKVTCTR